MALNALVYKVEGAPLDGEEKVGTRVVGELKVEGVASVTLSLKPERCRLVLARHSLILLVDILLAIELGHSVILQPGVHDKVAPAALVEEPDYGIGVGHFSGVAESDAGPAIARLCLDDELDGVARLQVLPLRVVGAVALVDANWLDARETIERPLNVAEALGVNATLWRIRPAADAPLLLRIRGAQH